MKIKITDTRKISSIQKEFEEMFPYLKIEFFSKVHNTREGSPKSQMQNSTLTLGQCRTIHNNGSITITPRMTVTELEQNFRKKYGLSVQVFRNSGKIWLETSVTDSWTLEQQNKEGETLSAPPAKPEIPEYDHEPE